MYLIEPKIVGLIFSLLKLIDSRRHGFTLNGFGFRVPRTSLKPFQPFHGQMIMPTNCTVNETKVGIQNVKMLL